MAQVPTWREHALRSPDRKNLPPSRLVAMAATILAAALAATVNPRPAAAGTIRHDRDPQAYLNLGNEAAFAGVGRFDITKWEPGFTGSGTLVGGQWVLTAAHLFEHSTDVKFNVGGREYGVAGWVNHPKWRGDVRRGGDLALVKLAEPVSGIAPVPLYTGNRELGATATFVGYGRTGNGVTGAESYDGLKRAGRNAIDGTLRRGSITHQATFVGKLPKSAQVFVADFDNPTSPADNVLGSPIPDDLEYLISLGDSGGGAFADFGDGRGQVLVGVHSFGEIPDGDDDSDYGDVTGHMRVSRYAKWARQILRRDALGRRIDLSTPGVTPAWAASAGLREMPPDAASLSPGGGPITVVPEPSAAVLLTGLAAGLLRRRPRR